jgi:WD40 repeat protein
MDHQSPDGNDLIASGSSDSCLKIWCLRSLKCLASFSQHTKGIECVRQVQNQSNHILATGSLDSTIRLWNIRDWESQIVLNQHEGSINCLETLGSDKEHSTFASGSSDFSIKIWRLSNSCFDCQCVKSIQQAHQDSIFCMLKTQFGILATGSADRTIKLWSLNAEDDFECLNTLIGHEQPVFSLEQGYDERSLISGSADGCLKTWSLRNGACLNSFSLKTEDQYSKRDLIVFSIVRSAESKKQMLVSIGSSLNLFLLHGPEKINMFEVMRAHRDSVYAVKRVSDSLIITGCRDGIIRVWKK